MKLPSRFGGPTALKDACRMPMISEYRLVSSPIRRRRRHESPGGIGADTQFLTSLPALIHNRKRIDANQYGWVGRSSAGTGEKWQPPRCKPDIRTCLRHSQRSRVNGVQRHLQNQVAFSIHETATQARKSVWANLRWPTHAPPVSSCPCLLADSPDASEHRYSALSKVRCCGFYR